jgi:hypothetical protein
LFDPAKEDTEMRRVLRPVILGLGVAGLLSAMVAVPALSAPPEYGRCLKVAKPYNGGFTNSGCTTKSETKTGKYEWYPGALKAKQTSTGGPGKLEEVGKYSVSCSSEASSGEYTGTKEGKNLLVKFKGCKVVPFICTSPGHEQGELETVPLEGRAVWENEKLHKTALDLYPSAGHETFIEFTCGEHAEVTVKVKGSVLVPIKADKMASTFTLKFKAKHGFQTPEEYEENGKKVKDVLYSDFTEKGYEQAGQEETVTVKNEEKLELNAYV